MLVASRDQVYACSLARLLEERGLEVALYAPGDVPAIDDRQIRLIDLLVIETDGLHDDEAELVERVRRVAPLVEVIAISSDPAVHEAVEAFRSGVFAIMQHPVLKERLIEAVHEASGRKRRAERRIRELDEERRRELRDGRTAAPSSGIRAARGRRGRADR